MKHRASRRSQVRWRDGLIVHEKNPSPRVAAAERTCPPFVRIKKPPLRNCRSPERAEKNRTVLKMTALKLSIEYEALSRYTYHPQRESGPDDLGQQTRLRDRQSPALHEI